MARENEVLRQGQEGAVARLLRLGWLGRWLVWVSDCVGGRVGWLGGRVGWVGLYPVLVCDWLIGLVLDLMLWLGWAAKLGS